MEMTSLSACSADSDAEEEKDIYHAVTRLTYFRIDSFNFTGCCPVSSIGMETALSVMVPGRCCIIILLMRCFECVTVGGSILIAWSLSLCTGH